MTKSIKLGFLVAAVILALLVLRFPSVQTKGHILLIRLFGSEATVHHFPLPERTAWKPDGVRKVSSNPDINARPVKFARGMRNDVHGSDEVCGVIAPVFELAWHAEPTMFVTEGPVFDSQGNIYFTPAYSPEEVIMVSIEPVQCDLLNHAAIDK